MWTPDINAALRQHHEASKVDLAGRLAYWADRMDGTDGKVSPQTVRDFVSEARALLSRIKST